MSRVPAAGHPVKPNQAMENSNMATKKAASKKAVATTAAAKKAAAKRVGQDGVPKTFDPDGYAEYICVICGRAKSVDAFYRHSNGRRNTRCRLCGAVLRGKLTNAEAEARWERQQGTAAKKSAAPAPAKKSAAKAPAKKSGPAKAAARRNPSARKAAPAKRARR